VFALLLLMALGVGGLVVAFPDTVAQYVPGLAVPTPTPRTIVGRQETVNDMEVIVPAGTDAQGLRRAFTIAYTKAVQDKYGPNTIVSANVPPTYIGGEPQKIGEEPNGAVKYRASMFGLIAPENP
jgi:hypothetical protein